MTEAAMAVNALSPHTTRICLTVFEATKDWCLNVPTIEGIKSELEHFYYEVVLPHPYISAAILLLWAFYPLAPFQFVWFLIWVVPKSILLGILTCLGFEREGIRSDSIASRYQSLRYGAYTPANSVFPGAQSYGAISHRPPPYYPSPEPSREPSHPVTNFFRVVVRLLLVYAVIVLLLQYSARHN